MRPLTTTISSQVRCRTCQALPWPLQPELRAAGSMDPGAGLQRCCPCLAHTAASHLRSAPCLSPGAWCPHPTLPAADLRAPACFPAARAQPQSCLQGEAEQQGARGERLHGHHQVVCDLQPLPAAALLPLRDLRQLHPQVRPPLPLGGQLHRGGAQAQEPQHLLFLFSISFWSRRIGNPKVVQRTAKPPRASPCRATSGGLSWRDPTS